MKKLLILNVDGASRGNPGPAGIGVTLKDKDNRLVAEISETVGHTTNNQAEYRALIAGLNKARSLGASEVIVRSDSELIVRQVNGLYRVKKADLLPLHEEVRRLALTFSGFKIGHIPREQNSEADKLANKALDSRPEASQPGSQQASLF